MYGTNGTKGAVVAGTALAFTGFQSLLFAAVGVSLVVVGFALLRGQVFLRKHRKFEQG